MGATGRLSRVDWIDIARKILVKSGHDDVKVDVLARRLQVTRGSFYWHFKDRQDLLDALLEDWQANNRLEIATIAARSSEDDGDLLELFRVWLGEDPSYPSFDFAIRGWARKSKKVMVIVREIDEAWINLFEGYFERRGFPSPESLVRARIMYFHQVGYFALSLNETLDERARLAPYYYEALTGMVAPDHLTDMMMTLGKPKAPTKKAGNAQSVKSSTGKEKI